MLRSLCTAPALQDIELEEATARVNNVVDFGPKVGFLKVRRYGQGGSEVWLELRVWGYPSLNCRSWDDTEHGVSHSGQLAPLNPPVGGARGAGASPPKRPSTRPRCRWRQRPAPTPVPSQDLCLAGDRGCPLEFWASAPRTPPQGPTSGWTFSSTGVPVWQLQGTGEGGLLQFAPEICGIFARQWPTAEGGREERGSARGHAVHPALLPLRVYALHLGGWGGGGAAVTGGGRSVSPCCTTPPPLHPPFNFSSAGPPSTLGSSPSPSPTPCPSSCCRTRGRCGNVPTAPRLQ